MSFIRSDNEQPAHPKPEFEHYLFLEVGVGYRDYADEAEAIAAIPLAFRKHKTVRIAGADYIVEADGVTFTEKNPGGGGSTITGFKLIWTATGGETTKTVTGAGTTSILNMLFEGVTPIPEYTGVLPVPAGKYKYVGAEEKIYFGTPLSASVDYTFTNLK